MVAALLASSGARAAAEVTGGTRRLAGPERITTATTISRALWDDGTAAVVVLARSDVPADALSATPLAAGAGPVLLSRSDDLPEGTATEIQRVLSPGGLVQLVGGTAALSASVEAQVQALGVATERIAGPNRFATAVAVADHVAGQDATSSPPHVWLADGATFADALLAGSVAGLGTNGVVLLTDGGRMPAETRDAVERAPASNRSSVGAAATTAASSAGVAVEEEFVGADAYETSRLLAYRDPYSAAALASGEDFADALAGGAHAATLGLPLLLTRRDELSDPVYEWFDERSLEALFVYGGTAAVSDAAVAEAEGVPEPAPMPADDAVGVTSTEPLLVEGWVTSYEGEDVRICSRLSSAPATPRRCPAGALVVEGLTIDELPHTVRAGDDGRFTQDPIVLEGTVAADRLTVTRVPPKVALHATATVQPASAGTVEYVDVPENRQDYPSLGQHVGLVVSVSDEGRSVATVIGDRPLVAAGDRGGHAVLSATSCPPDADCIQGLHTLDTSGIEPGSTYRFDVPLANDGVVELVLTTAPADDLPRPF